MKLRHLLCLLALLPSCCPCLSSRSAAPRGKYPTKTLQYFNRQYAKQVRYLKSHPEKSPYYSH